VSANTAQERRTEDVIQRAQHRSSRSDEMAVLGAMMIADRGSEYPLQIRTILAPKNEDGLQHFVLPAHKIVWKQILDLMDAGEPFDANMVLSRLPTDKVIYLANGTYLLDLVQACPAVANGPHYARNIANATMLRGVADAAAASAQAALESSLHEAETVLDGARTRLDQLVPPGKAGNLVSWKDASTEALEEMQRLEDLAKTPIEERTTDWSTPWPDVDELLGSLNPGSMMIIAGRPGMAKSTVARDMARHLAMRRGLPTMFFTMEMSRLEIAVAMMAAGPRRGIPLQSIRHGTLSDEEWEEALRFRKQYANAPLEIDDTPGMNIAYYDRALTDFTRRHGRPPVAYFVDYLQLGEERGATRQEQVSNMSRGHKLLAKKHQTIAVALSQLNRGPEGRPDKRPALSDLRESGSLEQDADVVLLLHRDDYYDPESPRSGEIDFIFAKHRGGPTGTVALLAQLHLSRVVSMAIV
jgi:replicative DNA helicase